MADTIPPDNRAAGQTGHISDHNDIADVLTAFQAQLNALPGIVMGSANLVAGSVTVPATSITTGSQVYLTRISAGGTLGQLSAPMTPGVGFTIVSASSTETSQIGYLIVTFP